MAAFVPAGRCVVAHRLLYDGVTDFVTQATSDAMPYGLYISAEGAHAQSTRLEVIANNLANVDTVGFKRELAILQARHAEEIVQGRDFPGSGSINNVGGGTWVRETKTDFAPGPFEQTGARGNVALRGDGFFMVQKGDERLLTRAGNFTLTAQGELVTQQGYPVLDEGGSPVVITDPNWQMLPSGAIVQNSGQQFLAVVKPVQAGDLARAGENLFRPLGETEPVAAEERQVAPGYLEKSSVNPTTEMVSMIEASRLMEANLNMMKAQDEMLNGLVNRVMRV